MTTCPVCHTNDQVEVTTVGFVVGRDLNRATCRRCGARGKVADWEDAAGRSGETAILLGGEWWVCDGFVPAKVQPHGEAGEEGDGA